MSELKNIISSSQTTEFTEHRRHTRYAFQSEAIISTASGLNNHSVKITNMSQGGVGIETDKQLERSELLELKATLGPKKTLFSSKAHIKWQKSENGKYKYGLKFADTEYQIVEELLKGIHISRIEGFLGCSIPKSIKNRYIYDWVNETYDTAGIERIVDFEKPFLKIDKVITFDSYESGKFVTKKSLSMGKLYLEDVEGHYNNTIFLAKCGQLMGQAGTILISTLHPDTAPQVVEVDRIQPILSDDYLWQPRKEGSIFFVETELKKKRLHVSVVNVHVSFGDILMGKVEGLKLILTPKNTIWSAKELPQWE